MEVPDGVALHEQFLKELILYTKFEVLRDLLCTSFHNVAYFPSKTIIGANIITFLERYLYHNQPDKWKDLTSKQVSVAFVGQWMVR